MDRIFALVEQMDLAVDQLRVGTPTAGRLGLILVDNAVELVLHTSCETAILLDHQPGGYLAPRYDARARAAATGQEFGPKVTFCQALGVLTPTEAASVRDFHMYRNELYHSGLRYDPIISVLAWEYFGLAADIIPRIQVVATLLVDPKSDRVKRYFPGSIWDAAPDERIRTAAGMLKEARPELTQSFPITLSNFAVQLVTEVQDDLEFLSADNPNGWNDQQVLLEIQFYNYAFRSKDGPQLAAARLPPGMSMLQRLDALRVTWTPRYRSSPVPGWLRRAKAIGAIADSQRALARFQSLRRDIVLFAGIAREAARALDAEIQLEIDRSLGK